MNRVIREVDVRDVEGAEFRHPAGGGIQEINHCLFPEIPADAAHGLQLQGRHRQALRTVNTDCRDSFNRVLPDQILLGAPLKERIQTEPDAFQGGVFNAVLLFIIVQVNADRIGIHLVNRLANGRKKLSEP